MSEKAYISNITNLFSDISSIVEIQCGSSYEIENCSALNKNISYIGIDVRNEIIEENRQYFCNQKNKIFITSDASNDPLPKADLIICNQMAQYLPIANIWSLLENIRDSGAKYFTFNYDHNQISDKIINSDITLPENVTEVKAQEPEKRAINLSLLAPFYFPQPTLLFATKDLNCSIALYKTSEVGFYMEWHNEDISKLRMEIIKKLDTAIKFLKTSFDKEQNGSEMFKEMLVGFLNINFTDHNQQYYFSEPYRRIIDRIGGLNARNNIFRLVYKSELNYLRQEGYDFVNEENFTQAQIITKDYIRWVFGIDLKID